MLAATGNERILLGFLKWLSTANALCSVPLCKDQGTPACFEKKESKPVCHKNEQIGLANAAGAGYGAMGGVSACAPVPFPFPPLRSFAASQPGIRDPLFY